MFTAVAIALVAISVPPGASPLNHNQPAHGGDPVVRVFEQRPIDDYRPQLDPRTLPIGGGADCE